MKTTIFGVNDLELRKEIESYNATGTTLKIQTLGQGLVSVKAILEKADTRDRYYKCFETTAKHDMNKFIQGFVNMNLEPTYQTLGKNLLVIKMIPLKLPK